MKTAAICLLPLVLVSCITSKVTPCGPNTYTVSGLGVGFSDGGTRTRTLEAANKFCEERGLVMVPIDIDSRRGEYMRSEPTTNLVFKAVKPGDPAIRDYQARTPDQVLRVEHR